MNCELVRPLNPDIAGLCKSHHASRNEAQTKAWAVVMDKAAELTAPVNGTAVKKDNTFLLVRIAIHGLVPLEEGNHNMLKVCVE